MELLVSVLAAAISMSAPIMYASVGEIISERSGILNLGLEGIMLMGGAFGYITVVQTGSLSLAILAVLLTGILAGLFYAFMTVTLEANQVVCGLVMVIFGKGFSDFFGKLVHGMTTVNSFNKVAVPLLSRIPLIGPVFFEQNGFLYFLYFLVPAVYFFIYKTRPGLTLQALGENPGALDAAGVQVFALRYLYVVTGCVLVSLGGAYVTLAYTPSWNSEIIAGRGWIAAALVIFASWNPLYAILGSILFGGIQVLGQRLQLFGVNIPSHFLAMLPYICTVAVLIVSIGPFRRRKSPIPAALGSPYEREAR
jgi:simple sugar transport system permease protein